MIKKAVRVLLALIGASSLALSGMSSVRAQGSQPPNGSFDSGIDGWTFVGGDHALWQSDYGHTANGSLALFKADTKAVSGAFTTTGAWELHVWCRAWSVNANVGILAYGSTPAATTPLLCSSSDWSERIIQGGNMGAGDWMVVFQLTGDDFVWFDDITVTGTTAATPTPGPTSTPGATPTGISRNSAIARVTLTAATPYYSTTGINGVIPYVPSGSGASLSELNKVEISTKQAGFCLPDQISNIVSGQSLCFSIPLMEFVSFNVLGINILPSLALIAGAMLVTFIIRQAQEK